jgi:hypothetical protein
LKERERKKIALAASPIHLVTNLLPPLWRHWPPVDGQGEARSPVEEFFFLECFFFFLIIPAGKRREKNFGL